MKVSKVKLYRKDKIERMVRGAAFEAAAVHTSLVNFNLFTSGYLQALRDMNVEKKHIQIFRRVVKRYREAYDEY